MDTCRYGHENPPRNKHRACLICQKEYQAVYRVKYRGRARLKSKKARIRWKLIGMERLGGRCVRCENTDPRVLQFDHLRDKKGNVGALAYRSWKLFLEEVDKCQLLCANCHAIKTSESYPSPVDDFKLQRTVGTETHCYRGHEYTSTNTYITKSGARSCRACKAVASRNYKKRKQASENPTS